MYSPIKHKSISHYGNNIWDCFSYKLNRDVMFYSELEYHHWILLECNRDIKTFCEQPCEMSAVINNEQKRSIVDMWIEWRDGKQEFVEVKYEKEIENLNNNDSRVATQIKVQEQWCKENNYLHRIVTDKHIRQYPLLDNYKIILPFIKPHNNPSDQTSINQQLIIEKISDGATYSFKELFDILSSLTLAEFYQALFTLYLDNRLWIDLESRPLNHETKVVLEND
jgi:hypothetical protein